MQGLPPIDLISLAILALAGLRGLSNGLIREVFSIGALAAAVVVVRVWNDPFAAWLQEFAAPRIGETSVPFVSGAILGIGVIFAVGIFGAVMGRGARAVGLGWADRVGGAALGIAEGAIVAGVVLAVLGGLFGRDHTFVARSRSLAVLEEAERIAGAPLAATDVASPPPES